ncbi:hypothetical protein [Dysgonomonas alginatilytica]|nr:hypothetical protein [Dysgonomonas alginatilytica]
MKIKELEKEKLDSYIDLLSLESFIAITIEDIQPVLDNNNGSVLDYSSDSPQRMKDVCEQILINIKPFNYICIFLLSNREFQPKVEEMDVLSNLINTFDSSIELILGFFIDETLGKKIRIVAFFY